MRRLLSLTALATTSLLFGCSDGDTTEAAQASAPQGGQSGSQGGQVGQGGQAGQNDAQGGAAGQGGAQGEQGGQAGQGDAQGGSAGDGGQAGGKGGSGPLVGPYVPPSSSQVIEDGAIKIRREVFVIDGHQASPNPDAANGQTPPELQKVRVIRYRVDADPPLPARSIAVLMPGFLGGGMSFEPLAKAIVRRSAQGDALEAWAVDRRSNLLEDHHGLDVAEQRQDPEIAPRYYLEDEEIEGKSFEGFKAQSNLPFLSEWGLETTVGDLHAIIGLVPQAERRARVSLIGHSLGASIAETYAAWDFDGTPGYSELSSLVLVDGVSGNEGESAPPTSQADYENGGQAAPGGFGTAPGVKGIRKSDRYFVLPFLGTKVYPIASTMAMRALWQPEAIVEDLDRDNVLRTLLTLSKVPRMTNRAVLGISFDVKSNGLSFAAVNCGEASGGAMTEYESLFGSTLLHPSDGDATYRWTEFDKVDPVEHTSLDDLALTWFSGPGIDFAEWYFPQRLPTDVGVANTLVLTENDWPFATYNLRAKHGASLDLPIFGHSAALTGSDPAIYDKLKALVAAVPLGEGRPAAGEPRSSDKAFKAISTKLSHIDAITATDAPGSVGAAWYDDLAAWMRTHSPEGGVSIPAMQ